SQEIVVQQPGYAYIYFSNDNDQPLEVFFDDFTVEHVHSAIVQADDYYPFGMTFNSYRRENIVANKYLYHVKELQNELGLDWYDYGARMYDAAVGRWFAVDPLADAQEDFSPYHYVYGNPIRFNDPTGMIGEDSNVISTWVHDKKNDRWLFIDDGYHFTFEVSPEEFDAIQKAGNIKDAGGRVYTRWFYRAVLEELKNSKADNEVEEFFNFWYTDTWVDGAIAIYEGNYSQ